MLVNKLRPALIKAINHKLKDAKKKKQKRQKIFEKRKAEIISAKRYKAKKEISSSNVKEENYKSNTKDNIDLDKANDKYLLQHGEAMKKTSYKQLKRVFYLLIR